MMKGGRIIIAVAISVVVIAGSLYVYTSGDHFSKSKYATLNGESPKTNINPFDNSTQTAFTINFTMSHYSGGPVTFIPSFSVNSSVSNLSEVNSIYNDTTTTHNGYSSSPYWDTFVLNVHIFPLKGSPEYGHFNYFQPETGSTGIGTDTILWSQWAGGIYSVYMNSINLPAGNYNVTVLLKYMGHQPSQSYLNLTNGSAWVNLNSLEIQSTTSLGGGFEISNLSIV